jgi:prepilin-type processing-associated H-X9-DG protein
MWDRRTGFSLIGSLALAAGLALAGALLFPVLVTAGERAPRAGCESNLREIGAAVMMYMDDYDGTVPLARSVEIDARPLVWESRRAESPFLRTGGPALLSPSLGQCPPLGRPGLWPLHVVLEAYVTRPMVWRDPADTGDLVGAGIARAASPASRGAFAAYGSSYQYHQGLIGRTAGPTGDMRLRPVRREELRHPGDVPLVFDGEGFWHGAATPKPGGHVDPYVAATGARGFNVLFADGRVRFVPAGRLLSRAPGLSPGLLDRDPRQ